MEQLRWRNAECVRQCVYVVKADVALTPFYTADVVPVEAGELAKGFLGEPLVDTQPVQSFAELLPARALPTAARHRGTVGTAYEAVYTL